MLRQILQKNNFSKKEANIYLAGLSTGSSPASIIAKEAKENRVTVYTILKKLCETGIAEEIKKEDIKYYTMLDPELLFMDKKSKVQKLFDSLPELLAITNNYKETAKNYFYDGYEAVQNLYKNLILESSKFTTGELLVFVGTQDIDPKIRAWLTEDFAPRRLNYSTKTKAIYSPDTENRYQNKETDKHENIYIEDKAFQMTNEIILYPNSKIAMISLKKGNIYAIVIESPVLYNGLKNIFNLVWNYHHKIKELESR